MIFEEELFARHRGKSILLDSNLLLVLLAGLVDTELFGGGPRSFKRVSGYTVDDFNLLTEFLKRFSRLLITPHILTEVGNLANALPESTKYDWYEAMIAYLFTDQAQDRVQERWIPAAELARLEEFSRFGITDSSLKVLSSEALIVTDDFRLSNTLRCQNIDCFNFQDLRALHQNFPKTL